MLGTKGGTGVLGPGTLRAGAAGLGLAGLGTFRAGTGLWDEAMGASAGSGVARPVSRVVRSCRAATWLSARGASGELAEGLEMAVVRSCRLARMRPLDDARGMVTFLGKRKTENPI